VPIERIEVIYQLPRALDAAVADAPDGRLFALPTYTALLELREELAARGHVGQFWQRAETTRA
jgi:lipid II isoglutaminyl synthase (glutamine-hydrolysing)